MNQQNGTQAVGPVLLTPEEAADALRLGRSMIYDLMRTGDLESVKVGKCRRVPVDALSRFVDTLRAA